MHKPLGDEQHCHFAHSGDIGDIVYSLPTVKAVTIRDGKKAVMHLCHYPGRTAHGMSEEKVNRIRPLLVEQEYIESVIWEPSVVEHNLNGFRDHYAAGNLADCHLSTHGLGWEHRGLPWLRVKHPRSTYPVVVSRSPRYNNDRFPWPAIVRKYSGRCGFVGTADEYKAFCGKFGLIGYIEAGNLLEVARVISGSRLFIGNQSSPAAIAHGLKADMIQEVCPSRSSRDCIFQRMNCILGWDEKIELPEVT